MFTHEQLPEPGLHGDWWFLDQRFLNRLLCRYGSKPWVPSDEYHPAAAACDVVAVRCKVPVVMAMAMVDMKEFCQHRVQCWWFWLKPTAAPPGLCNHFAQQDLARVYGHLRCTR